MDTMQILAEQIMAACPDGYNQALLQAELDSGYAQLDLRFTNPDGEEFQSDFSDGLGFDLHDTLDSIREEMGRSTGHRWSKCTFAILQDKRFKFDVEY
jgi:hypothetical protein